MLLAHKERCHMSEDWARPLVHWAIQARDPKAARAFYSAMFNWQIEEGPIMAVPAGIGGPPTEALSGHILPGDTSRVVLYIQVRDLKESMQRAETLGGAVLHQPFDVPNGPTIAGIADPEGNPITLVQQ
jgi:predicted enzyme related to lactoylglutathione lyase